MKGKYEASDTPIAIVGGLLLWVGWLFFNASSGYEIIDINSAAIPQRIILNTFLAPCASALTFILVEQTNFGTRNEHTVRNPSRIMNAILAGLVAITASCNNVTEWSSILIGIIGSLVYMSSTKMMIKMKIDDPIEAS